MHILNYRKQSNKIRAAVKCLEQILFDPRLDFPFRLLLTYLDLSVLKVFFLNSRINKLKEHSILIIFRIKGF